METPSSDELQVLVRLGIERFSSKKGQPPLPLPLKDSLCEISEILASNLAAGRLDRQNQFRAPSHQLTVEAYLDLVIPIWIRERDVWCRLHARETKTWRVLEQALTRSGKKMLQKRPLAGSVASTIEDYVQLACINILRARYHFDLDLQIWTRTILKNTIRTPDRSGDALDRWHFSLDAPFVTAKNKAGETLEFEITDDKTESRMEQIHERQAILQALGKLSERRQAVLILTFFEGLSDKEITAKLAISMSNLHSTRHRALKQLCQRMEASREQE